MWWLPVAYILILGKRRSPCERPAVPADEPANTAGKSHPEDAATYAATPSPGDDMDAIVETTARAKIEALLREASFTAQREFPVVGTEHLPTPWDHCHHTIDRLLHKLEASVEQHTA